MGRRGPLPMSDTVRALRGTHPERASTRKPPPVMFPPGVPIAPADLSAEAAAEWERIVPQLNERGLLATIDRGVLASYCRAWAHACAAEHHLADGLLVVDKNGDTRKTPAWQIWRDATTLTAALAKELLITPSARLRATMPTPAADHPHGFDLLD